MNLSMLHLLAKSNLSSQQAKPLLAALGIKADFEVVEREKSADLHGKLSEALGIPGNANPVLQITAQMKSGESAKALVVMLQ